LINSWRSFLYENDTHQIVLTKLDGPPGYGGAASATRSHGYNTRDRTRLDRWPLNRTDAPVAAAPACGACASLREREEGVTSESASETGVGSMAPRRDRGGGRPWPLHYSTRFFSTHRLLHISSSLSTPPLLHRTGFSPPFRLITAAAAAQGVGVSRAGCPANGTARETWVVHPVAQRCRLTDWSISVRRPWNGECTCSRSIMWCVGSVGYRCLVGRGSRNR
jgi:hypothetical protein